jgi:AraC family transcriptional regulator of adaptative response/methylated-DNA-[protein]-cysteine methyltransferase
MDDERRWTAVQSRDSRWNGRFVYAVRSTGVYCRPSCPSRRPQRDQVLFFELPELADRAGFRPCRRCRPQDISSDPRLERVRQAVQFIDARTETPPTLAELSVHVGTSPTYLQREFKKVLGIAPREYAEARRLNRFKEMVRDGNSLSRSIYDAGYGSSSRLYERAGAQLGMTPATYRRGGKGMEINYAIADSPLGRLLVAATGRGVCAVTLGDSDAALDAGLRNEFPAAAISRNDRELKGPVEVLLRYLEGDAPHVDLPLDVRATAFQRQVWQHLRTIPQGRTATYSEVARAMGQPTGARAVARACATNPVAMIIPCHRVVPVGGGLGGYRWGTERKRALLDRERRRGS